MERINIFFILLVCFACAADGSISSTETYTSKSKTNITTTNQNDQTDPSNKATTTQSYAANETVSDTNNTGDEQTKQRTNNEMSAEELTSWFTGAQTTLTTHINRAPKTSPITQKPTTHIQPVYEQVQTTVSTDSYTDNSVTQISKSSLSTLLSTDKISDSVGKPATDIMSTTYPSTKQDVESHGSRQTSTMNIMSTTLSTVTYVKKSTPKETEAPMTTNEETTIRTGKTTTLPVTTQSTELPVSKSSKLNVTEPPIKSHEGAETSTGLETGINRTTTRSSDSENNGNKYPSKAKEMESLRSRRIEQLLKLRNGTRPLNMSKLEHFDPDEISPAELANFLNTINQENKILREKENSDNLGNVEVISMDKLLVVVCTISAAFILFIAVMCITHCRKGKPEIEPQNESMKSYILELSRKGSKASNGKVNSDTFMGIPTNNDIWRELQTLPEASSSIMSESNEVEISKF